MNEPSIHPEHVEATIVQIEEWMDMEKCPNCMKKIFTSVYYCPFCKWKETK